MNERGGNKGRKRQSEIEREREGDDCAANDLYRGTVVKSCNKMERTGGTLKFIIMLEEITVHQGPYWSSLWR